MESNINRVREQFGLTNRKTSETNVAARNVEYLIELLTCVTSYCGIDIKYLESCH